MAGYHQGDPSIGQERAHGTVRRKSPPTGRSTDRAHRHQNGGSRRKTVQNPTLAVHDQAVPTSTTTTEDGIPSDDREATQLRQLIHTSITHPKLPNSGRSRTG